MITKSALMGLSAAALVLSGSAHAAETRAASALPAAERTAVIIKKAKIARSTAPAAGQESAASGVAIGFAVIGGFAATYGIVKAVEDDSK